MALLLAFAAKPEELEVLMVSLTFGNIDVQKCVVSTSSLIFLSFPFVSLVYCTFRKTPFWCL